MPDTPRRFDQVEDYVADLVRTQRQSRPSPPQVKNYTKLGPISAGVGTRPLRNVTDHVLSVSAVQAEVGTAPASDDVIIDVTVGGTSIFTTTFPTVSVGSTVGTVQQPPGNQWMPGDELLVNVTQGDTSAADLYVTLVFA